MQTHLIPCVHTCSVDFADGLLSTCFPTWHSSLHVLNKWLKVESCQEVIDPARTSGAVN